MTATKVSSSWTDAHYFGGIQLSPASGELERERLARLRYTPALTMDGQKVELLANIEQPTDGPAARAGAVGVGLLNEFLFMGRSGNLPGEEEQYRAYREAIDGTWHAGHGRTLDVGLTSRWTRPSLRTITSTPHWACVPFAGAWRIRHVPHPAACHFARSCT
ncbi:hypothetical protein J4711_14305, partial [Staphylococcus epidermidis]|nr:hypothetical protein [Staphylococcus epidermidis]